MGTDYRELFDQYISGVLDGTILAGKLQRLAVERHVRDLEQLGDYYFDEEAAFRVCGFFGFIKHSKGKWAGQVFVLSPWQVFITACLFGWKRRSDGLRRFRTAYIEVPRKCGKSTYVAALALYLLIGDGEAGAEVYCAATKRDQAKIVFSECVRMVKSSHDLNRIVKSYRDNLNVESTYSKLEPLSSDYNRLDGLNPHACIVDELHAHKTRFVWDLLDTATGARSQPLLIAITTAGMDQSESSICWEQHEDSRKILEQVVQDETIFAFIAAADDGDDYALESTWRKANPNFGVSIQPDDMARKCTQAARSPRKLSSFLRLHLGRWVKSESQWLKLEDWEQCAGDVDLNLLEGEHCYGGLDLANRFDLNAFVLIFPPDNGNEKGNPGESGDDGIYDLVPFFWMPEGVVYEKSNQDSVDYRLWADLGYITLTDGDVVDYQLIQSEIEDLSERFRIDEIAYDPYNATQLAVNLESFGLEVVQFNQNIRHYNEPSKLFESLITKRKIRHPGNPVMDWMVSCVAVKEDADGNIRPVKPKRSTGKRIDGVSSSIMALSRAMHFKPGCDWCFIGGSD